MENKTSMMTNEDSEVLYKFRVTGTDGKPFVIFNGVSANSWLSPVGIRLSQEDKDQIKLPQRPKSSGSIMIIRHHPSPKGLNRDEVIQGVRIDKRFGDEKPEERPRPRSELARPSGNNTHRGGARLTSAGRPHTAFSNKVRKRQALQRKSENYEHPNLELTIQSLNLKRTPKSSAPDSSDVVDKSELMPASRLHSALIPKNIYTSAMFAKRAKSAPPNVRSDTTKPAISARGPSLYWRAKSAYHRKMLATSSDMDWDIADSSSQSYKGSMLRPLLYCEDGELKHSAGCPYKCKGCFRACLVSKDYLEKMKKKKEAPPRKNIKHRPMIKKDARFVMHMALARNQPIYKIVHGDEYSRTEAWAEKHAKENTVNESESSSNGEREQLTSVVQTQSQSVRSGQCDIKDVNEKAIQQEKMDITRDSLPLNYDTKSKNKHATMENTKHAAHFKLLDRNTVVTEYEHDSNISSENVLYCKRNISGQNYTEHEITSTHCHDTNRRLSRGVNKHCSFDKTLPVESSPPLAEHNDHQSNSSKSYSASPVEKAIRSLYDTECKTPESAIVRSESSGRSEIFSKKSETFSAISEQSKFFNENPEVLNEKSEGFNENNELFDDSLTNESTISLGLPSDDDADTLADSISSEMEDSYDSNRETSPSVQSLATHSEYSTCSSQRHHNRTSNNKNKHNKINYGANTVDQRDSPVIGNESVHDGDNGITAKGDLSVTNHFDNERLTNDKENSPCVNNLNKADDKNIATEDEKKHDVKHTHNKTIVSQKRIKQRTGKIRESKRKVIKKNVKQTRVKADVKDDEDTNEQDSSTADTHENSEEEQEEDDNSDNVDNANEDSDPKHADSDSEQNNDDSETECSKQGSGSSDTEGEVSQVDNSDSETDHNNNDADDSKQDSCDSNSDDNVEDNENSKTQDDDCNNDDNSDIEDGINKDDSESDENTEDKEQTDTDDNVKDDFNEDNDNTENKDNSDTEDSESNEDRCESDTEDKNDSCTDEDNNRAANDNSDIEDTVTKEENECDSENNKTDTDDDEKEDSESHTVDNDSEGDDDADADDDDDGDDGGGIEEESVDSVSNDSGDDDIDDDDDDDDGGSDDNSGNDDSSNSSVVKVVKSRRR